LIKNKKITSTSILLASAIFFYINNCSNKTNPVLKSKNIFVSSDGDDINPGTFRKPWKTLERVNRHTFNAGDTIFFSKNSNFSGGLLISDSGTKDKPIVLTYYGDGHPPKFTNPDINFLNGNMIQIKGDYIIIDGLYFHNGVSVSKEDTVSARSIGAIYLTLGADNNIVKNCEMFDCPVGIQSYGQYNLITNNYIHDCNRFLSEPNWGPVGIMVAKSNHEISYNRITNYTNSGGAYGADGGAIEIDNGDYHKEDIYIHHNWSIGNQGFLEIIGWEDLSVITRNVRVAYNVSDDYQQFIFFWSGRDCIVENNTVICTRPQNSRVRVVFSFFDKNNIIRNNIFVVANNLQVFTGTNVYGAELYDEQIFSNNLYWSIDKTQLDPCGLPLGEGDIISDPDFIDIANLNFRLNTTSPAIDAGMDLGYNLDFENNNVPTGPNPDIGAFEYNSD
tara:strand:+ start:3400 stop:4740 length:1341 start_codon:yes stop_codon:yes gene_type:complete